MASMSESDIVASRLRSQYSHTWLSHLIRRFFAAAAAAAAAALAWQTPFLSGTSLLKEALWSPVSSAS